MVRTLRITSLVSVAAACAAAVFVLVFGFKPNSEIKSFLSQDSIVEQLKKKIGTVTQKEDKVSPLVTQAKAFAVRIDPPPPPPPKAVTPPPPRETPIQTVTQMIPPPSKTAKFDLAGTAHYKEHPEKSLALLNLVSEGYKWVRQGEKIGSYTIHEVRDGSVVLYQNGKLDKELFVPKPENPIKSLLKSDQLASASISRPSSVMTTEVESLAQPTGQMAVSAPSGENLNLPGINRASGSDNPAGRQGSAGNVRIRRSMGAPPAPVASAPPVQSEPALTPEQQKQSLDDSISGIKDIMNTPMEGMSEQERQEQTAAWKDLLDLLESEKKSLDQNSSKPSGDTSDKKEATKDNSGKDEKK